MDRNITKEICSLDHSIRKYVSNGYDPRRTFNMTQFQIILYLMKHCDEDVCQKDLESETHLKKASITGAIDSLTEKGFVYRDQAESDHRKNYIRLTDKVIQYTKDFEDREKTLNRKITDRIPEKDLETFYSVIDMIRENIKEITL